MRLPSPNVFNIILIGMVILQLILPIPSFKIPSQLIISIILMVFGLALNIWASRFLSKNKTSRNFGAVPNKLVNDGPFGFSRNPIYLGGVAFSLGVSFWFGSYIVLFFVFLLFISLNWYYIPLEENSLKKTFGEEYVHYMNNVRRWI